MKTSKDDLDSLDPFPDEYRALRIGTPINADTNELLLDVGPVFDWDLLAHEKLVHRVSGESQLDISGGGTTTESQDAVGWGLSAELKLNAGVVGASANFYVKQTLNACRRTSKVTVVGALKSTDSYAVLLQGGTRDQYLKCATPKFRQLITEVIDAAAAMKPAANPSEPPVGLDRAAKALTAFYRAYGTGFINKVALDARGVFEGTLTSSSDYSDNKLDVGGGGSISIPLASAGAAATFCNEQKIAHGATNFVVRVYGRPEGSGPDQWAKGVAAEFAKGGIDKCTTIEPWNAAFDLPATPTPPPNSPLPLPTPTPSLAGALETVRAEALTATVAEQATDDTDAIARAIRRARTQMHYASLDAKYKEGRDQEQALAAEAAELRDLASKSEKWINDQAMGAATLDDQTATPRSMDTPAQRLSADSDRPTAARAAGETGISDPFPGYTPCDYTYTSFGAEWLFHELGDIAKECTNHQVAFGQALLWFSIRGIFAQYLNYCAQYPGVAAPDIEIAADQFNTALEGVGKDLDGLLRGAPPQDCRLTDLTLQSLERGLKERLDGIPNQGSNPFMLYDHYKFWIDNYEWLKELPFGVVPVVQRGDTYHYQSNPYPGCPLFKGGTEFTSKTTGPKGPQPPLPAASLVKRNAYRLYPILATNPDGNPYFAWVGPPSRLKGDNDDNDDADLRYSGLFSLSYPDSTKTPAFLSQEPRVLKNGKWHVRPGVVFNELTMPMLIQQSVDNAQTIARAETDIPGVQERWDNRKLMWGISLYPGYGPNEGFDTANGFDAQYLLAKAGQLAGEASRYARVLPAVDDITAAAEATDGQPPTFWRLREPKGAWAAYKHKATLLWGPELWGPEQGPGWDQFDERCEILLVPIGYGAAKSGTASTGSGPSTSHSGPVGGGPMWKEPRTAELRIKLNELG